MMTVDQINAEIARKWEVPPISLTCPGLNVVTETESDGRCLKRSPYVRGRPANNGQEETVELPPASRHSENIAVEQELRAIRRVLRRGRNLKQSTHGLR